VTAAPSCLSGPPVHLGFAVVDLDAAMARFAAHLGLGFGDRVSSAGDFLAAGRPVHWAVEVVKSSSGEPPVELLQGGPGSTWRTDGPAVLHHYAWASDDVDRDTEHLLTAGWTLDLTRPEPGSFSYFVRPGSPRIELCAPPDHV
jgi:catechol 2,3-dioxygenase-like lactoylglutathione lyase family enzyme